MLLVNIKGFRERSVTEQTQCLERQRVFRETLAGNCLADLLDNFSRHPLDSGYMFKGDYTRRLVDKLGRAPTHEEVIILVHGTVRHYGATCAIDGMHVCGRVFCHK